MKKFLFFLILLIPLKVLASNLYIDDLSINNGELSLDFNKYNNLYTVILDKDVYNIDFNYKVSDDIDVTITNNYDLKNEDIVSIILKKDNEEVTYKFQVLKEEELTNYVFLEDDSSNEEDSFMFKYKIYVIPICSLIIIFLGFKVIFHKKKKIT